MGAILDQLGLDQTLFTQLILFFVLYIVLANVYFKPFLKLFEARHKRIVEDRQAADGLMQQAQAKFDDYRTRMADERARARKEFEALVVDVKKEEANILAAARQEAKKVTQEAQQALQIQHGEIKKQLTQEVEQLADTLSNKLLARQDG